MLFSSSRDAVSPSSLCSGVVVSRVRTSSSIHRFRRRFHRSRFLVWWCTRLVVLWSPSSSSFPPSFSGQRWIGRRVSATPTSTMSSPTPPRPLWTKSSASSRRHRSRIEKEALFWGRRQKNRDTVRSLCASHSKRKDGTQQKRAKLFQKGKKKEGENAQNASRYIYLVRRARIRAHLRVALVPGVVHPDASTARDRVVLFFLLLLSSFAAITAFFFFSMRGRRH